MHKCSLTRRIPLVELIDQNLKLNSIIYNDFKRKHDTILVFIEHSKYGNKLKESLVEVILSTLAEVWTQIHGLTTYPMFLPLRLEDPKHALSTPSQQGTNVVSMNVPSY